MGPHDDVVHSRALPDGQSGELIQFTRQSADWEWMSFSARRLAPGDVWQCCHPGEETACVLLSGKCTVAWGTGRGDIGGRGNVFDGLPYALYLTPGDRAHFTARSVCEIAECHVP